jgi:hypothetical protein
MSRGLCCTELTLCLTFRVYTFICFNFVTGVTYKSLENKVQNYLCTRKVHIGYRLVGVYYQGRDSFGHLQEISSTLTRSDLLLLLVIRKNFNEFHTVISIFSSDCGVIIYKGNEYSVTHNKYIIIDLTKRIIIILDLKINCKT